MLIPSPPTSEIEEFCTLYIGSNDVKVYALTASLGNLVWSYTTVGSVFSSPAVVGGIGHVGSDDGRVSALSNGSPVWSFSAGSSVQSSPAQVNSQGLSCRNTRPAGKNPVGAIICCLQCALHKRLRSLPVALPATGTLLRRCVSECVCLVRSFW